MLFENFSEICLFWVKEFLDTVKATDSEGNDYFDFTQVNPIPSELQDVHTGAITIDEVRVDAWYEDDDDTRRPLLEMVKDELKEVKKCRKEFKKNERC